MTLGDNDLVFRAKALAQAHPLTALARRYSDRIAEAERASQPMAETAIWASTSLLTGYCVRRVEEDEAGLRLEADDSAGVDLEVLDAAATRIATHLQAASSSSDSAGGYFLGDGERVVAALDRIIAGEVERRLNNLGDDVDRQAWDELGDYMTFWVVKGYALRIAEAETGGVVPVGAAAGAAGSGGGR